MMLSTGIYNARIFKEAFWGSTNPGLLVRLGVTFVRFHQNIGKLNYSTQCNKFQIKVICTKYKKNVSREIRVQLSEKNFIARVLCNRTLKISFILCYKNYYDCNIILILTKLTIIIIITG